MASTTAVMDCAEPGVMDLIFNEEALQIWEFIRSPRRAVTKQEIHTGTGIDIKRIQLDIDVLMQHGLLRMVRPRKPRKTNGYIATANQIVIAFDEHDTEICDQLKSHSEKVHAEHLDLVSRHADPNFHPKAGVRFRHSSKHCLTKEEFAELRRRIHAVVAFLNMPRNQSQKPSKASNSNTAGANFCNQAISIRLEPLVGDLLPSPTIITTTRSKLDKWDDSKAIAAGLDSLTPREHEVTIGIADGLSRVQIADQLDISRNTVSTLLRRAYKKLGVSSQAQLVSRLANYERPQRDD
tara:strand:+ start:641 stop:1525 length:885 start_codon:yes stop_codon:yes gene_type:complete